MGTDSVSTWISAGTITAALILLLFIHNHYFRPLGRKRRELLRAEIMCHYLPARYVLEIEAGVVLQARHVPRAPWFTLIPPRRESLFFYTSRHGKGSKLNHGKWKGEPYARVDIAGSDFFDRLGAGRLWWRPYDGAVAIFSDYVGPATITRNVNPITDRTGE